MKEIDKKVIGYCLYAEGIVLTVGGFTSGVVKGNSDASFLVLLLGLSFIGIGAILINGGLSEKK